MGAVLGLQKLPVKSFKERLEILLISSISNRCYN